MLPLLILAALAAPVTADGQRRGDQVEVWEALRQGRLLSIKEIERRILPTMRGADYIGFDFVSGVYTLKFVRDGNVIWIDVDGRSGQVIGRTGR